MKKKIILPFLVLSFFLFIVKFINIFRVMFYLIITGSLRKIYLLRGNVTLIKINDRTVLKLPTEYDFIVLLEILLILIICIILFVKTMKKNEQNTKTEESGNRLDFYTYKMPKSRTAKYCLGCYEGSVFIDFNQKNNLIYLERISFDEFGCLNIGNSENTLSKAETNIFEKEIKKTKIDEKKIKPLVLKLIRMNQEKIGSDIFKKYKLLK